MRNFHSNHPWPRCHDNRDKFLVSFVFHLTDHCSSLLLFLTAKPQTTVILCLKHGNLCLIFSLKSQIGSCQSISEKMEPANRFAIHPITPITDSGGAHALCAWLTVLIHFDLIRFSTMNWMPQIRPLSQTRVFVLYTIYHEPTKWWTTGLKSNILVQLSIVVRYIISIRSCVITVVSSTDFFFPVGVIPFSSGWCNF